MFQNISNTITDWTKNHGISGSVLKVIAVITMIIDHVGMIFFLDAASSSEGFYNLYYVLRAIGRISFPIYAFLIAEGIFHTKNIYKYLLRIVILAVICEVPFDIAINGSFFELSSSNVFFTFALAIAPVAAMRLMSLLAAKSKSDLIKKYAHIVVFTAVMLICMKISSLIGAVYSYYGIALVLVFYLFRDYKPFDLLAASLVLLAFGGLSIQLYSLFALPIILFYNGRRGFIKGSVIKYIFYGIYPVHLLVLYVIYTLFSK